MKLEISFELPLSVEAWYRLTTDHDFQIEKCRRADAIEQSSEIIREGQGAVVRTTRVMDTGGGDIPDLVKKVIGGRVTVHETVTWAAPDEDGNRTAVVAIRAAGHPIEGRGQALIQAVGPGVSRGIITVDVKARIPLIGGKVERIIGPEFRSALEAEESVAREWAESRPPSD